MNHFFFWLGLAFILTHEMDAVARKEWQILPVLSKIRDDKIGVLVFMVLHIPLYTALFWGLFSSGLDTINLGLVRGLNLFFVVHVLLHFLLRHHSKNQFNNWFSWLLIIGAGLAGAIDLLLIPNEHT